MSPRHRGTIVAVVLLSAAVGCSDQRTGPTALPGPPPSQSPAPPAPPAALPPVTGPATLYDFYSPSSYEVGAWTRSSRYVLYTDGQFALQYPGFEYTGRAIPIDDNIHFEFGGGAATGVLDGDLLTVQYTELMQHSDFDNAIYKRSGSQQ